VQTQDQETGAFLTDSFTNVVAKVTSRSKMDAFDRNGSTGIVEYQQAMALLALLEMYGLSRDKKLMEPCLKGLEWMLKRRKSDGGWHYDAADNVGDQGDVSMSTWAIMVMKAAKMIKFRESSKNPKIKGIKKPNLLKVAARELDIEYKSIAGSLKAYVGKLSSGDGKYKYIPKPKKNTLPKGVTDAMGFLEAPIDYQGPTLARTILGVSDYAFLYGKKEKKAKMSAGVAIINRKIFGKKDVFWGSIEKRQPLNYYLMYYGTLSLFQYGGDVWKKWNKQTSNFLVKIQEKGAKCQDGSWPHERVTDYQEHHAYSRTYSTTLGVLQLEVYYRYARK
jgi:hypothetical protein